MGRLGTQGDHRARPSRAESGFSLIEIVIAMLVLALMALGVLPLILSSVQISTSNRSLVAATTFANAQLAELRAAFGNDDLRSCSELVDETEPDPADHYLRNGFADPAGTGLTADRRAPELEGLPPELKCAGASYETVAITVTVHPPGDPDRNLVTLTSKILVSKP